ncbi:hypothetical protein F4777DRAFT_52922 [Nemania sp. FL0916]|nr:hypothetical protein F4777DRAFT_52922 [Nemania sp. FL0916]
MDRPVGPALVVFFTWHRCSDATDPVPSRGRKEKAEFVPSLGNHRQDMLMSDLSRPVFFPLVSFRVSFFSCCLIIFFPPCPPPLCFVQTKREQKFPSYPSNWQSLTFITAQMPRSTGPIDVLCRLLLSPANRNGNGVGDGVLMLHSK